MAAALHYLRGDDVVHLDVKPDNIVMGIPPRLIDLSLARSVERARRLTDYIGTNAYMPPEQCAARRGGRDRAASRTSGDWAPRSPRDRGRAPVLAA